VRKQEAHFSKPGGGSEVWEVKTRGALVVVDNKNVKIEETKCFGESERKPMHKIVWNDVGGNRMRLAPMNEELRNHEEHVDEELRE